jgi:hypothetical protein
MVFIQVTNPYNSSLKPDSAEQVVAIIKIGGATINRRRNASSARRRAVG